MTLQRETIRRVIWNLMGYVLGGVVVLALPTVLIKTMGRAAYGLYSYVVLLLSQTYLLNLGLGEALAFYLSRAPLDPGQVRYWARHALGGILLGSSLGAGLWMIGGPEGLIHLLQVQDPAWEAVLLNLRWSGAFAILGYGVAIGLSWIPLSMGRGRSLLILPLGQAISQGLIPLGVAIARPGDVVLLGEATLLSMGLLGPAIWAVVSNLLRGWLWPAFSVQALRTLWGKGLWQGLSQWSGLFLNYYERTLIGRYVSLGQMGLFSAGHYFFTKVYQVLYKAAEALLPSYGPTTSFFRKRLRLYQTMWLLGVGTGSSMLLLQAWAPLLLAGFISPWGLAEERLTSGVLGAIGLVSWFIPTGPFMISQGQLKRHYVISLSLAGLQVLLTIPCLRAGLFLWPTALACLLLMGLMTYLLPAEGRGSALWRYWVFWPFMRLGTAWLAASLPTLIEWQGAIPYLISGLAGFGFFLLGESWQGHRKHVFLKQLLTQLRALWATHAKRFSGVTRRR